MPFKYDSTVFVNVIVHVLTTERYGYMQYDNVTDESTVSLLMVRMCIYVSII